MTENSLYDKNGVPIAVGDVVKVFHFTSMLRREKMYMYKQVMCRNSWDNGVEFFKIGHLDMSNDSYTQIIDNDVLTDYEVVQSVKCDHRDRVKFRG